LPKSLDLSRGFVRGEFCATVKQYKQYSDFFARQVVMVKVGSRELPQPITLADSLQAAAAHVQQPINFNL
jgi:hypothetical protein